MSEHTGSPRAALRGHPISVEVLRYDEVFAPPLRPCGDHIQSASPIERLYQQSLSCLVVKGAFESEVLRELSDAKAELLSITTPPQTEEVRSRLQ